MEMKKLLNTVSQWLSQGKDVVLATIIESSGSTPRAEGARMAMTDDGNFAGTIGGGALEYKIQQIASNVIESKKSFIKTFVLSPNDREDLGMVCGGNVTVYIQFVSCLDKQVKSLFEYGVELFSKNVNSWLVTDITCETEWRLGIFAHNSMKGNLTPEASLEQQLFKAHSVQLEVSGRLYHSEPLTRVGRVYVFGGGHISQELVPLLSHLGFCCVVFDSIPEFSSEKLFPDADSVITGDFSDISSYVTITENDYVIIMTRGHTFDFTVQAQALRLGPFYIGAIGSRKKIEHVTNKLLAEGFSRDEIARVHSPIGIAIKADTPAEIAVSIAAELILKRAQAASP